MPNLEVLDLTDNQIMVLSQLENLKKLTHLAEVSELVSMECFWALLFKFWDWDIYSKNLYYKWGSYNIYSLIMF